MIILTIDLQSTKVHNTIITESFLFKITIIYSSSVMHKLLYNLGIHNDLRDSKRTYCSYKQTFFVQVK